MDTYLKRNETNVLICVIIWEFNESFKRGGAADCWVGAGGPSRQNNEGEK